MKQLLLIFIVAIQYGSFGQCNINADFDYSISSGNIDFTNTTTNQPTSPGFYWEYGGQTSSSENPSFVYSAGIPFACLTVWDLFGTCSDTICISIIDSSGCNLNIDWTESTSGGAITFTNTSTGEPTSASYAWLYGTQTSSMENPTFTFDPAVTQVCFAINDLTGNNCDDSICGPVMATDSCDINVSWTAVESGGNITFTNTSSNEPANPGYFWEYGGQTSSDENPTFFYSLGFTTACLTIWDISGSCADTVCAPVVLDSAGCNLNVDFDYWSGTTTIHFTDLSTGVPAGATYDWWYGSQSSSDQNPTFNLESGDVYACLTIYDSSWTCYDSVCVFITDDSTGCNLDVDFDWWSSTSTIYFTDLSTGVPAGATYDWWYGSQSSSDQNPTFNLESGDVYACLTIYDSSWTCYDSVCVFMTDSTGCNLDVDFTMTIDSGYVYFYNTSTGEPADANYDWWYGSQNSTLENPMFVLEDSGAWVCFTVYDSIWSCYDSTCFWADPASASVDDLEELRFELYPNPASSEVNISLSNVSAATISIFDASGRLVRELNTINNSKKLTIEVSEFEKGIYIINVLDVQTSSYITKRFVKL